MMIPQNKNVAPASIALVVRRHYSNHYPILSLFPSFSLPDLTELIWREGTPIWGDNWSHSPFIRRSPSWGFLGFSSAVRQMPGYLCTAPRIISLSPLSLETDVTDATLGASGLWLGNRTGGAGTGTLAWRFFGRSLWLHERQKKRHYNRGQWAIVL